MSFCRPKFLTLAVSLPLTIKCHIFFFLIKCNTKRKTNTLNKQINKQNKRICQQPFQYHNFNLKPKSILFCEKRSDGTNNGTLLKSNDHNDTRDRFSILFKCNKSFSVFFFQQNYAFRSVYSKWDFNPICCRTKLHSVFDLSS